MQRLGSPRRRLPTVSAIGLALAVLVAGGAPVTALTTQERGFQFDLGQRADFVAQTNLVQCVGASMQMMVNMIGAASERDRTAATQLTLQRLARQWSPPRPDRMQRRGASVFGWATGLMIAGAGHYKVAAGSTIDEALLIAARAMRRTGRPAGLLMWRGRHAWVMSGFRATADPASPDARVTSVIVEDPLYPLDSRTWGASPAPGSRLSVAQLARQFVPRRRHPIFAPELGGKYVVVIPYEVRLRSRHRN